MSEVHFKNIGFFKKFEVDITTIKKHLKRNRIKKQNRNEKEYEARILNKCNAWATTNK